MGSAGVGDLAVTGSATGRGVVAPVLLVKEGSLIWGVPDPVRPPTTPKGEK